MTYRPTLTRLLAIAKLGARLPGSIITIAYEDLLNAGDEARSTETLSPIASFVITGVNSTFGTLKVGTTQANAIDWSAINAASYTVSQGTNIYWSPYDQYKGDISAFEVAVKDAAGQISTNNVAAVVRIDGINQTQANTLPTGQVTITGEAKEGQVLTVSNTLADANGIGKITYQWLVDGEAVAGANGRRFTLGDEHVGKVISVAATYTDASGFSERVDSAFTGAVANLNQAAVGSVAVSGTAQVGSLLTAAPAVTDGDGLPGTETFTYQWYANGALIAGATDATYTVKAAEVGKAITVALSYTDLKGTREVITSAASQPVAAAPSGTNSAHTGAVQIIGTPSQGQTLTAVSSLADADGMGAVAYQWYATSSAGVTRAIAGATGKSFTISQAEADKTIKVVASFADGKGFVETATSAATASVQNIGFAATGSLAVSTLNATTLQLTATDIADLDGIKSDIVYQWQANGVDIAGANGTTLDITRLAGKTISVKATFVDGDKTTEVLTSNTYAVTGATDVDAPTLMSAVTGATLGTSQVMLTFSEELSTVTAGKTRFKVMVNGVENTVMDAKANGTKVVLTLKSAIAAGQTLTVSYTDPSAYNDTYAVQDLRANDAASFIAQPVTNLVPGNLAPTIEQVSATAQNIVKDMNAALPDFVVSDLNNDDVTVTLTAINGVIGNLVDENPGAAGIQVSGKGDVVSAKLANATFTATGIGSASIAISATDGTNVTNKTQTFVAADPATLTAGTVIDGYIAGARVFADTNRDGLLNWTDSNGNGRWDASEGEAWTTTDELGHYQFATNESGKTLISTGGIDTSTKLGMTAVLRAPSGSTVITPLTTVLAALVDAQVPSGIPTVAQINSAKSSVLTALGLGSTGINLATYDAVAVLNSTTADATAKATALAVQQAAVKIVNLLSMVVEYHGVLATKAVLGTLAAKINAAPSTVIDFANATTLASLLPATAPTTEVDRLVRANTTVAGAASLDALVQSQILTQGDFAAPKSGVVVVNGKDTSADRDFTLAILGQEPGSIVQFQSSTDGTTWSNTTATQTGVALGNHYYRALVVDAAGNSSLTASKYVKVSADLGLTPATPVITLVNDSAGTTTGPIVNGGVTDDKWFSVQVSAGAGQTVNIFDNGMFLGKAIETGPGTGVYVYNANATIGLWRGTHQITAVANDEFGNFSAASGAHNVKVVKYLDTEAGPYVSVSSKVSFPDGTFNLEFQGAATLSGKYVSFEDVTGAGGVYYNAQINSSGFASIPYSSVDASGSKQFAVRIYSGANNSGLLTTYADWFSVEVANSTPDLVAPVSLSVPTIISILDDQVPTTGNVLNVAGHATDDRRPTFNIQSSPVSQIVVMDGVEKLDDVYVPNLLNVTFGTYQSTGTTGYITLLLKYDQVLSSVAPLASQFTVKYEATATSTPSQTSAVTNVSVSGQVVTLTVATPIKGTYSLSVAYNNSTSGDDAAAIQSVNGYDAASFTAIGTLSSGMVKTVSQVAEVYSYTPSADLAVGSHDIKVKTVNPYMSATSATQTVVISGTDTTAPTAPVIAYANDDQPPFTGLMSQASATNDATPTLTITAEANCTVNVYDGSTLLGQAVQTAVAGTYSFTPDVPLASGSHDFKATATDASLNISTVSAVFTLIVDAIAPNAGNLSIVNRENLQDTNFDLRITGQESGSIVNYEYSRDNGLTWIPTSDRLNNLPGDTYLFRAKVTDAVGNTSTTASVMAVVDALSAPDVHPLVKPVINLISVASGQYQGLLADGTLLSTDSRPTVTITAEAGQTIQVYGQHVRWIVPAGIYSDVPEGIKEVTRGALLGTATETGVAGSYTFTPTTDLPMGTTGFMAMALDSNGNTSAVSNVFQFNVGYKDPANGVVVYLEGKESLDDSGFNIRAINAPAGASITFERQYSGTTWSGLANDYTGYDTIGYFAYVPGDPAYDSRTRNYRILINGIPSQNTFTARWDKTQTSDLEAPVKPLIVDMNDNAGNIQGTVNWGGTTEDTTPTLRIVAEKGSIVRVFDGETLIGYATETGILNTRPTDRQPLLTGAAPGVFTFTPAAALAPGAHNFYVRVSDASGNSSELSDPYQVRILSSLSSDTTAPAAPMVVVVDDVAPIVGVLGLGASTNDKRPTLKITAEVGSNVDVYRGNVLLGHAVAGANPGEFTFTPATDLAQGIHELRITASDGSGNLSVDTLVSLVVDTVAPNGGTLVLQNKVDTADNTFNLLYSGQEAGAAVVLERSSNGFVTASAVDNAQNGLADGTYQYRVKVSDAAGNVGYSNIVSATVNARTAANTVDVNAPVFKSADTARVAGYAGSAQVIYTAEASDGASGTGNIVYSLESGIGQAYLLGIDAATGNVTLPATPGLKRLNSYSFNVIATDEAGNASKKSVTVGLTGVTIYGVQAEGYQLTASVTDADGNVKTPYGMSFQWAVDGEEIAGANRWSFMPNAWDIGKVITVKATYTDGAGNKEVYTSAPTAPIADLAKTTENVSGVIYQAITKFVPSATTWSLQGADAAKFRISDTGEVSFIKAADYEAPDDQGADHIYNFQVLATSLGLTEVTPVALKVADVATGMQLSGLNNATMLKSATPQLIDTNITFDAADNLAGAKLTISGLTSGDVISVYNYGTGAGMIGLSGTTITFGGDAIGTISTTGGKFVVDFTAAASQPAVDALMEALTFANSNPATAATSRTLSINIVDHNGADLITNGAFTELTGSANPFNGFDAGTISSPAIVDINGDGRLDLVSGNKEGTFSVWTQNADHSFTALTGSANPLNGIKGNGSGTYSTPAFIDLNGDGKLDLVTGDFSGKRYSYLNASTTDANGVVSSYTWTPLTGALDPFDEYYGCRLSTLAFTDINGDGQKDMVLGTLSNEIMIFTNDHGVFTREIGENGLLSIYSGDVGTAYAFTDLNGDGFLDVVAGGAKGYLAAWINTSGDFRTMTRLEGAANPFANFQATSDPSNILDSTSGWSKPVFADLFGNGDTYMISGNANGTFNVMRSAAGTAPQLIITLDSSSALRTPVTITSGNAVTVNENSSGTIYTATGSGVTSWSLEGLDAARFTVNSVTGTISFNAPADFETPLDANNDNAYDIILRGTGSGGISATRAVTVNVANVADTRAPEQEALYLINRFRADPQGELARIMGVSQFRLDTVDSDGAGPDVAIIRSSAANAGDGTQWSTNFWQNFLGAKSNLALSLDFFKVNPGDLLYQWDHLPKAGSLQPLLPNAQLAISAANYAQIVSDDAGLTADPHHVAPYAANDYARFLDAGYAGGQASAIATAAENLARDFNVTDAAFLHAGYAIDWGNKAGDPTNNGLQDDAGHRANMLGSNLTEAGIGQVAGWSAGAITQVQHFGDQAASEILWGYVWDENSATASFSLTEALANVTVQLKDGSGRVVEAVLTNDFGGYAMDVHALANGAYSVEVVSDGSVITTGAVVISDAQLQQVNWVI